jgi:2',3'-cyclic-nucleotide 2'-phosphodiesterase (5'-nucleotidase family)
MTTKTSQCVILATSDIHGHIYPTNYRDEAIRPLGLAKLATLIKQERLKKIPLIYIDNGDLIQGSPLMYYYHKTAQLMNPMIDVMNHLGLDAWVMGNHEFNFGQAALKEAMAAAHFPTLAANITEQHQPLGHKPYTIHTLESGIRIAILGVTTHFVPHWEAPQHIDGLTFHDAFTTTKNWVKIIRSIENVDALIVSYHGGFERDLATGELIENDTGENVGYRMLHKIDGIDCLITGHQHQKRVFKNGKKVAIQPGVNGESLGKITIDFSYNNHQWQVTDVTPSLIPVTEETVPDGHVLAMTETLHLQTEDYLDQPIGETLIDLRVDDPFKLRQGNHPLIDLINQIQREVSGAELSLTSLVNDEAPGFYGMITRRDILATYVYPNTLTVIELTGEDIRHALEQTATYFALTDDGNLTIDPSFLKPKPVHYNYDMWDGIDYTLDITQPVHARVTTLQYQGKPIDPMQTFRVVMNHYRARGGGNYTMFQHKPVIKEIQRDMTELIAEYIEARPYFNVTPTGRFQVRGKETLALNRNQL